MGYISELRKQVGSIPLIMVGACIIVEDSENKVLLQLRSDNHRWGLPGGSLELGESLEACAKRELYEETGLVAKQLTLIHVFSGQDLYYRYPHGDEVYNVVAAYSCRRFDGTLAVDGKEGRALSFYPKDELPIELNRPDQPILQYWLTADKEGMG
ncbi:NUDIX hydrolase [Aureibacillus halotolerans]|uniref:ADP-ribose pyrophosphatase YjhB (NUDIX family) n=1 Tax=Aureibacillus halotolerans TaxID=1508390 RepID=A0A4R6TYT7_9BACI|nr:NUDIX hydrolase [Aureibacillus halotolerans]TDQ37209.1 ADP-ribose pyrophosphatase YjhB (NUDIX family) [Aureibacillus halotolerans]